MKNSALIVTITSYSCNCGNRLQNYALQKILSKHVSVVRTLSCSLIAGRKFKFLSNLPPSVSAFILKTIALLIKPFNTIRSRELRFRSFFFSFNKNIKFEKTPPRRKFDYYVTGSDQVWNTISFNLNSEYVFLSFCDGVKIAYAASIGMRSLSDTDRKLFSDQLQAFSAISVRENDAKQLLEPICDKDIAVILDPTLMLSSSEWDQLAKRPKNFDISGEYVFKYTLGEGITVPENIASNTNIPIWNFFDTSDEKHISGPLEFLWLIKNAKFIVTDSFHAIVFSLIYHKPFMLLSSSSSRAGMFGRFETLCCKLGLDLDKMTDTTEPYTPDYDSVEKLLKDEREKSSIFLSEALQK